MKVKTRFYLNALFVIWVWMPYHTCLAQKAPSVTHIDSLIDVLLNDQALDISAKSALADSTYWMSLAANDICRQVFSRAIQSTNLDDLGLTDSALTQLYWAQLHFQQPCDSFIYFTIQANLTSVFLSLGELTRIDSIGKIALSRWNPAMSNHKPRFVILNNQAIAHVLNGDTLLSMQTFRQVYREAKARKDKENYTDALINLGTIKALQEDLDSAYYFFQSASDPALKQEDVFGYMELENNLANIDIDRKRYGPAAERLDSLFAVAVAMDSKSVQAKVQNAKARLYEVQGKFSEAYHYVREYNALQEEALNSERVKAVTEMMEKYESEKKAKQIQELEVVNLSAKLQNEKITNTRNRFLYGGVGILMIALGLLNRMNNMRKSRRAIQKEKDISEGLLLNILPASVADELKQKGFAEANHFDRATILFSDFKDFTFVSEHLTPAELVKELNVCFRAFDEIMTVRGIEKIKTIGDAYMATGGIPERGEDEAPNVILAALDMQDFIVKRFQERRSANEPAFEMRVGVHSGPVVAGIVGVKKFQYDIWGDTVNIANRMESNGEIGKVNISEVTYQIIKDDPRFTFVPRGKRPVKGKGEMTMYFVARKDFPNPIAP